MRIQEKIVLQHLNWQFLPGECHAIYGANGAGKSTFFKLLRGDLWPENMGKRSYNFGKPTESPLHAKINIALVSPEDADWYMQKDWELSAKTVVLTGLSHNKLLYGTPTPQQEHAAEDLLEELGLIHVQNTDLRLLSQGQRRRVLLARALISKPKLLILDEFFEGVDAQNREFLKQLLTARAVPVIYSTHRQSEDLPLTTHSYTLEYGTLRAGKPAQPTYSGWGTPTGAESPKPKQTTPVLHVDCPEVYRGDTLILKNILWTVQAGEHWAVLGANGSGKSTLARLIHKDIYPAHGGKVEHWGTDMNAWQVKKRMAFVAGDEQYRHKLDVPVRILVGSGLASYVGRTGELSAAEWQKVDDTLAALNLHHLAEALGSQLSHGQLKRVLLARAVVLQPEVIILDEPFDYLDQASRQLYTQALTQLAAGGVQFITIAHHPEDIPAFTTQFLKLQQGEISHEL